MFRKTITNAFTAVAFALIIAACSSTPDRPQWIDLPSSKFPESTYLTAVGSADEQQAAGDRATANIAKVFEVAVQETLQDSSSAFVVSSQGQQQVENKQTISRKIQLQTKKVVEGAKVEEYWQSETGRYYALASLAKQPAANRITQDILNADKEIHQLVGYASSQASNPLVALKALSKASQQQNLRDENNRSLMVLKNGQGIKGKYDSVAIEKLKRDALGALKVEVQASNDSVRAELQQALASIGVSTVEKSNLVLKGHMDLAPVSFKQGWFWQRGAYELMFKDSEKVLAKQRYPVKVSAQEQGMVEQRLKDELNKNLTAYVFELMSVAE